MRLWIFSHLICFSTFIAMLTRWQSPVTPWHPKMCCLLCSLTQSNTVVPLKDRDRSWLLHPVNISLQFRMNHPLWPDFQIFHSPAYPVASNILQVSIISHQPCHDKLWLGVLSPPLPFSIPSLPHGQSDLSKIQIQSHNFPDKTFNTSSDLIFLPTPSPPPTLFTSSPTPSTPKGG